MPLIRSDIVISLAYITSIHESMIKDEVIDSASIRYIKPILTLPLYNDVVAVPANYAILINTYIAPCLAF